MSFFETMIRVLISVVDETAQILYLTKLAPDIRMADVPSPFFRVRKIGNSDRFRKVIESHKVPGFHQLQWVKTLNHKREERFQEALLSAAITLETLIHLYIRSKGLEEKKSGIAPWIRNLAKENKDLAEECEDVAKMWLLRNDVVHEQRKLDEDEIQILKTGIQSLTEVRAFFLESINPELLDLEKQFTSFLEPIPFIAASDSVDGMVPIRLEWRRETDHYQTVYFGRNL